MKTFSLPALNQTARKRNRPRSASLSRSLSPARRRKLSPARSSTSTGSNIPIDMQPERNSISSNIPNRSTRTRTRQYFAAVHFGILRELFLQLPINAPDWKKFFDDVKFNTLHDYSYHVIFTGVGALSLRDDHFNAHWLNLKAANDHLIAEIDEVIYQHEGGPSSLSRSSSEASDATGTESF